MELSEFKALRDKVQALIQSNHSLKQEAKTFAEKLISRERRIQELKERCQRYEKSRKEAHQRVTSLLNKIESLKP